MVTAVLFIKYPNWKQFKYASRRMKKHEILLSNKNEQTNYINAAAEAGIRGGMVGTDLVVLQNRNSGMT